MTSISFTGDIAFSKYFKDSWSDDKLICDELIDFLHSADYTVANVEGAMTDRVMTRGNDKSTLSHASSPKAARWLDKIGSNIWNLSNNHTLDCTGAGLAAAIEMNITSRFAIGGRMSSLRRSSISLILIATIEQFILIS